MALPLVSKRGYALIGLLVFVAIAGGFAAVTARSNRLREAEAERAIERAQYLLSVNDPQGAQRELEALGPPERLSSQAILTLSAAHYSLADFAGAIDLCDLLASRPDADPRLHWWKGLALIGARRSAAAEEQFQECLRHDVAVEDASVQLAKIYAMRLSRAASVELVWKLYQRGKPVTAGSPGALASAERVLQPELLIQCVMLQYYEWEGSKILDQLLEFHERDPDDFEAQLAYARGLLVVDRAEDAWPLLVDLDRRLPRHERGQAVLLQCALTLHDQPFCERWLSERRDDFLNSAELWELRGQIHASADRHDQAAEAFRKAVAIDPYFHQAYHRLGRALVRLGRRQEAAEQLRIGRELNATITLLMRTVDEMQSSPYGGKECLVVSRALYDLGRREMSEAWLAIAQALGADRDEAQSLLESISKRPEGRIVARSGQ